jgi:hypothetical protein
VPLTREEDASHQQTSPAADDGSASGVRSVDMVGFGPMQMVYRWAFVEQPEPQKTIDSSANAWVSVSPNIRVKGLSL